MTKGNQEVRQVVAQALRAPYTRIFRAEEEGGFSVQVLEFPGCYSSGDDATEAMTNVEEAIAIWVESQLRQGQVIPPPPVNQEHSGRVTLRLPPSLHERAAMFAAAEEVSLNRFFAMAIAQAVGERAGRQDLAAPPVPPLRAVAEEAGGYRRAASKRRAPAGKRP